MSIKAGQFVLLFAAGVHGGQCGRADLRIPRVLIHVETRAVANECGGRQATEQHNQGQSQKAAHYPDKKTAAHDATAVMAGSLADSGSRTFLRRRLLLYMRRSDSASSS